MRYIVIGEWKVWGKVLLRTHPAKVGYFLFYEKNLQHHLWPKSLTLWTIYSATTFLEKCRKVVSEIWFEKSGSRKMVLQTWIFLLLREKWLTRKKRWFYTINPHFLRFEKSSWPEKNPSLKNHFSRTTFLNFSRKEVAEWMVHYAFQGYCFVFHSFKFIYSKIYKVLWQQPKGQQIFLRHWLP